MSLELHVGKATGDEFNYRAIDNAVARIALAPVRKNLPTWGGLGKDGAFHSRQSVNESILPERGYRSDPVHVLSINWATSGPGFSWPLKYYISWINPIMKDMW